MQLINILLHIWYTIIAFLNYSLKYYLNYIYILVVFLKEKIIQLKISLKAYIQIKFKKSLQL